MDQELVFDVSSDEWEEEETKEFVPTPYGFYILLSELIRICQDQHSSHMLTYANYLKFGRFLVDCQNGKYVRMREEEMSPDVERALQDTLELLHDHGWNIHIEQWRNFVVNQKST